MKKLLNGKLSKGLLCAGCTLLAVSIAEGKPDHAKGKGEKGGKGGGSDHSEKQNSNKGGGKDHKDHKGHKDDDKGHGSKADYKLEPWRAHRFEDSDRNEFSNYFKTYEKSPQGLPPGLAKNLERGKPLPPGWQKKVSEGYIIEDSHKEYFQPLEDAWFPKMKPVPDTKMYLYGDRVVRVYEPKRQVIDLFQIPSILLK